MKVLNDIKGNPLPFLAGAAIGYYIVDQKMKSETTIKKVLIVGGAAVMAHLVYVQLTSKKNEPVIYNGGLPPVQGVRQTPVYKVKGTNGNIE